MNSKADVSCEGPERPTCFKDRARRLLHRFKFTYTQIFCGLQVEQNVGHISITLRKYMHHLKPITMYNIRKQCVTVFWRKRRLLHSGGMARQSVPPHAWRVGVFASGFYGGTSSIGHAGGEPDSTLRQGVCGSLRAPVPQSRRSEQPDLRRLLRCSLGGAAGRGEPRWSCDFRGIAERNPVQKAFSTDGDRLGLQVKTFWQLILPEADPLVHQHEAGSFVITDAKSLYDAANSMSAGLKLAERRSAIELAGTNEKLRAMRGHRKWCNSDQQLADGLTTTSARASSLESFARGVACLKYNVGMVAAKKVPQRIKDAGTAELDKAANDLNYQDSLVVNSQVTSEVRCALPGCEKCVVDPEKGHRYCSRRHFYKSLGEDCGKVRTVMAATILACQAQPSDARPAAMSTWSGSSSWELFMPITIVVDLWQIVLLAAFVVYAIRASMTFASPTTRMTSTTSTGTATPTTRSIATSTSSPTTTTRTTHRRPLPGRRLPQPTTTTTMVSWIW